MKIIRSTRELTGWIWIRCLNFFSFILASLLILIGTRILETHATQRLHGLLSSKLQLNWRINTSSSSLVTIRFELLLLNSHGLFFLITTTVCLPNLRMVVVEFLLLLGVAILSTQFVPGELSDVLFWSIHTVYFAEKMCQTKVRITLFMSWQIIRLFPEKETYFLVFQMPRVESSYADCT